MASRSELICAFVMPVGRRNSVARNERTPPDTDVVTTDASFLSGTFWLPLNVTAVSW